MRILHVINTLKTGGAENLVAQIVPRMISHGYEVEIALFVGLDTHFEKILHEKGVRIHVFSTSGSVYHPKHIIKLRKLIKEFDIIHTHNTSPQIFGAIANLGIGKILVTTEHGGSNRRRSWKFYSFIDRWMYRRYDNIICISDKTRESLCEYIRENPEKIKTIYNGVDVASFANADFSFEIKDRFSSKKIITMVAGFRWEKDQPTLIKAIKYLPDEFQLFLVGDGPRRNEYENLTIYEGIKHRVHFLGLRTDIAEILHASDYIVMSSHFEGLSLSSVEGMSVGKPFLASDVDGLHEVVNGAGILFPHQNPKALAEEILKLENNPSLYKIVSERCLERASQYDISKMVDGYLKIYHT